MVDGILIYIQEDDSSKMNRCKQFKSDKYGLFCAYVEFLGNICFSFRCCLHKIWQQRTVADKRQLNKYPVHRVGEMVSTAQNKHTKNT